jgi:hypothetical protein
MVAEAERALEKHGPENTMDAPGKTDGYRLAILGEEFGEVCKELTYDNQADQIIGDPGWRGLGADWEDWGKGESYLTPHGFPQERLRVADLTDEELAKYGYRRVTQKERLRKELVQVGAMAATWIALLDSEESP